MKNMKYLINNCAFCWALCAIVIVLMVAVEPIIAGRGRSRGGGYGRSGRQRLPIKPEELSASASSHGLRNGGSSSSSRKKASGKNNSTM